MIQAVTPRFEDISVFCDPENILYPTVDRRDFPNVLRFLLAELRIFLWRKRKTPNKGYRRLYLEQQRTLIKTGWHEACEKAVHDHHFQLYWSQPGKPAEELLADHIQKLAHSQTAPTETYVISGDGDLIPSMDLLRRWRGSHKISFISCLSWSWTLSSRLGNLADQTIYLEDALPETKKWMKKHSTIQNSLTTTP